MHQDATPLALSLQDVADMVFAEGCWHETEAVLRAARDLGPPPGSRPGRGCAVHVVRRVWGVSERVTE